MNIDFKDTPILTVMLSKVLKGKAPSSWGRPEWAKFHTSFTRTELTPHSLAAEIWRGYSFTPVFNHRRKEENFIAAHHMAFDFDADGAALDFLMRAGTFADYFSSFAYSTPSSTLEQPKSRVVFVFESPIESPDIARKIYMAIAWRFALDGSYCDPQCKDPLRLYFGSPKCQVVGNWSILTQSVADWLVSEYDTAHPQPTPTTAVVEVSAPPQNYVDYTINKVLDSLRFASPGERHKKRRNVSRAMGGYVAAGHIDKQMALLMLIEAAGQSTENQRLAEEEVTAGLDYGMTEPLYIEWQGATPIGDMLL